MVNSFDLRFNRIGFIISSRFKSQAGFAICGDDRPAPVASLTYSAYETYNPG